MIFDMTKRKSGGGAEPSRGFVPLEWSANGSISKGKIIGMNTVPNYFLYSVIADSAIGSLRELALPNDLTTIGHSAFYQLASLASVSLPDTIITISDYAFYGCTSLTLTTLPAALTTIGSSAFQNCTALNVSRIPHSVTQIAPNAFRGANSITSLIFEGKPTSINSRAFLSCNNLTSIMVPWSEGEVAGAPWGATNATIHYNYTED